MVFHYEGEAIESGPGLFSLKILDLQVARKFFIFFKNLNKGGVFEVKK